jgi:diguanylate cyclase (GGDEF)-like protein
MNTNNLMNQLAVLTSVRDLELLELGLLKALMDVLRLPSIKLLTIDWESDTFVLRGYVRGQTSPQSEEYFAEGALTPRPEALTESVWGAVLQARDSRRRVSVIAPVDCGTVYPLVAKDFILGYVLVAEDELPNAFEFQLIEGILRVFHNYYLLLEDSQKDKLTGLLNRRTFEERINKLLTMVASQAEQPKGLADRRAMDPVGTPSFWLAVMDVDNFKRVNDTFGHIYGDEVLLMISQLMKRAFRSSDLLFRFGGEEFIIVLKAADRAAARRTFERFREAVAGYRFPQLDRVTVSLGSVQVVRHATPSDLVGLADQALYKAKRSGRNRTVFFDEMVEAGATQRPAATGWVDWF